MAVIYFFMLNKYIKLCTISLLTKKLPICSTAYFATIRKVSVHHFATQRDGFETLRFVMDGRQRRRLAIRLRISELKEIAPLVEEQPFNQLYKRKEALETAHQPAVTAKKIKPRFRISNGQLIMIEPGNMEVATNGIIKETAPVRLPKENAATCGRRKNSRSIRMAGYVF